MRRNVYWLALPFWWKHLTLLIKLISLPVSFSWHSELDYVTFKIHHGQENPGDTKLVLETVCFSREGLPFKDDSISVQVSQLSSENEVVQTSKPFSGRKSSSGKSLSFILYVRKDTIYTVTFVGGTTGTSKEPIDESIGRQLLAVPIR